MHLLLVKKVEPLVFMPYLLLGINGVAWGLGIQPSILITPLNRTGLLFDTHIFKINFMWDLRNILKKRWFTDGRDIPIAYE